MTERKRSKITGRRTADDESRDLSRDSRHYPQETTRDHLARVDGRNLGSRQFGYFLLQLGEGIDNDGSTGRLFRWIVSSCSHARTNRPVSERTNRSIDSVDSVDQDCENRSEYSLKRARSLGSPGHRPVSVRDLVIRSLPRSLRFLFGVRDTAAFAPDASIDKRDYYLFNGRSIDDNRP